LIQFVHISLSILLAKIHICRNWWQLPAIVDNASRKICMPGDRVLVAGDRSASMFIVCSGRLKCEVKGVEVRQLGVGDSFGEVAVFAFRTWILHREHAELLGNATALESL
jgi:hypothetical protein